MSAAPVQRPASPRQKRASFPNKEEVEDFELASARSGAGLPCIVVSQDTAGMLLRKTKEQREAVRAELERQDREHAARLAAVSAQERRPALFASSARPNSSRMPPPATTAAVTTVTADPDLDTRRCRSSTCRNAALTAALVISCLGP
jgi:hypothetical protein